MKHVRSQQSAMSDRHSYVYPHSSASDDQCLDEGSEIAQQQIHFRLHYRSDVVKARFEQG